MREVFGAFFLRYLFTATVVGSIVYMIVSPSFVALESPLPPIDLAAD